MPKSVVVRAVIAQSQEQFVAESECVAQRRVVSRSEALYVADL